MYRSLWNIFSKSVCSFNFYSKKGIQFFRSSGFRYSDYIISDSCTDEIEKADYVQIDFPSDDPQKRSRSLRIPMNEFRNRISGEEKKCPAGILVLPIKPDEFRFVNSVSYSLQQPAEIGTPVAIFSYSHQINQLYMKTGMVSSYIRIKGEEFIFVESSIEQGNSGSPLVNANTGKVIGVMADCASSPCKKHKELKMIIDQNIRVLKNATGKWSGGNIDPAQVLRANQYMIKQLARDIYLSTQRNYGFAIPFGRISRYIRNLEHRNQIEISHETGIN